MKPKTIKKESMAAPRIKSALKKKVERESPTTEVADDIDSQKVLVLRVRTPGKKWKKPEGQKLRANPLVKEETQEIDQPYAES